MSSSRQNDVSERSSAYWQIEQVDSHCLVFFRGHWQRHGELPSGQWLIRQLASRTDTLTLDGSQVQSWSSVLPALLFTLQQHCQQQGIALLLKQFPAGIEPVLRLASQRTQGLEHTLPPLSVLAHLGNWGLDLGSRVGRFMHMTLECGVLAWRVMCSPRRSMVRAVDVLTQLCEVGASALMIVLIINLLVGGILGFVGLIQLQQFGAHVFLADMVGIAMVREMAAIMTAIAVAGRSGAAFAANLATMQANEEIDALQTFGVRPLEHLLLPRLAAMVAVMPLLYIYGCAAGIVGGLLVAVSSSDLTVLGYLTRTGHAVGVQHFIIGALKSLCFGGFIGLVSCQIGLQAGRSAEAVGRAATAAVVTACIGVITLDAAFALLTYYLGV